MTKQPDDFPPAGSPGGEFYDALDDGVGGLKGHLLPCYECSRKAAAT